jgi:hypothetical protein
LFAGGAGLLIPPTRKWAALLSGIANTNDVSDRMGLCESFTFIGIFFVLAGMFSGKKVTRQSRFYSI